MKKSILHRYLPVAALSFGFAAPALAATITVNGGGSTNSQPVYTGEFTAYTNSTPSTLWAYDGISSSTGQSAFLTNNIALLNSASTQYGTFVGTTVHFAASDSPLSSSQVSGYTLSGVDGPLIQVPTIGVGVAIAFENTGLGTKLNLTDSTICGIFSGKLTNWTQISKTATPGTIAVVYRSDSAASTFLMTQHFNAVCTSANSSFPVIPVPITKTFATLFTGNTPPSNFIGASGSAAVASTALATPLSIAYVSPDYTSIAPKSGETTSLPVASITNATNNTKYTPTVSNIELGLNNAGPGSVNTVPPSTQSTAANPLNWFPTVPTTTKGYPIVGYSSWDVSSCYSNASIGSAINSLLTNNYSNKSYQTIIQNDGSAPLTNTAASPYVTAVKNTFLSNKNGYNLNIDNATLCKGLAGR